MRGLSMPAQSVMSHLTLEVEITGLRVMRLRQRFGIWLMRAAAGIIGCKISVEIVKDED